MRLLIRTDANAEIGYGHAMRCLALAQACQDRGGDAMFALTAESASLMQRLEEEGIETCIVHAGSGSLRDATFTAKLSQEIQADCIIADSYAFGSRYQRTIKDFGENLLVVDDYQHAEYYYADFILNQNLHAHDKLYVEKEDYTSLLLGSSYLLLRRDFLDWEGWFPNTPEVAHRILVTMGGGNQLNETIKVIQAIKQLKIDDLEVVIVLGAGITNHEKITNCLKGVKFQVSVESNVTNMATLMAEAELAIVAGGSTCWELAFMGVPLVAIVVAENQLDIADDFSKSAASFVTFTR